MTATTTVAVPFPVRIGGVQYLRIERVDAPIYDPKTGEVFDHYTTYWGIVSDTLTHQLHEQQIALLRLAVL